MLVVNRKDSMQYYTLYMSRGDVAPIGKEAAALGEVMQFLFVSFLIH